MRTEAPKAEVVEELHHSWQTVVFTLLWGHGVKFEVVLLSQVNLLALSGHLHGKDIEHYLVKHHSKPENIDLLCEAWLVTGLFRCGIGYGKASFVSVRSIELRLEGGIRLSEINESEHEGRVGLAAIRHDL